MVRNTFLLILKNLLDSSSYFSHADFTISVKKGSLTITYEYDENCLFQFFVPKAISTLTTTERQGGIFGNYNEKKYEYEAYEFSGTMRPGRIAIEETFKVIGENDLKKTINGWLSNLWEEVANTPEFRNIKKLDEDVQVIKQQFDTVSDEYFSKAEAEALIEKLNKLECDFKEKMEAEIEDKAALNETIVELHNEINKLKAQATVLNKRSWFKSFGSKIFVWLSKEENRKFLKDGKDFIKPLLPNNVDSLFNS